MKKGTYVLFVLALASRLSLVSATTTAAPAHVQPAHVEPRGCPHLHHRCYTFFNNSLTETRPSKDDFVRTYLEQGVCTSRLPALNAYAKASFNVCPNAQSLLNYFTLGDRERMILSDIVHETYYLPLIRSFPLLKLALRDGRLYPQPGELISNVAAKWHYDTNVSAFSNLLAHAEQSYCGPHVLTCTQPTAARWPHDYYTGIPYPGTYTNWYQWGCRISDEAHEIGTRFCNSIGYDKAQFIQRNDERQHGL